MNLEQQIKSMWARVVSPAPTEDTRRLAVVVLVVDDPDPRVHAINEMAAHVQMTRYFPGLKTRSNR